MLRFLALLLAAFSLVASACSDGVARLDSGQPDSSGGDVSPGTTAADSPADDTHYRWQVGDCILVESEADLPYEPYGRASVVDCSEPHAYEVYYTGDFDEGDDAPYPDDIGERAWEACAAAFKDYVGIHLSESGLDIVLYQPDRSEWDRGLRYQACVVQDPSAGDGLPLTTGSLEGIGDAIPFTGGVGDCYENRAARGPGVPCSTPHRAEIIGLVTLDDGNGEYPGIEELQSEADAGCVDLLGDYATAGAAAIPAAPVTFARLLSRAEWDDGLRTVRCTALVFDSDRRHLMVVGSLADPDWWVIGAQQAA